MKQIASSLSKRFTLSRAEALRLVIAVAAAWGLGISPAGRVLDGLLTDTLMRNLPLAARHAVVVITVKPERMDEPAHLLAIVDGALDSGASAVGLLGSGEAVDAAFLEALAEREVVLGRERSADGSGPEAWPEARHLPRWGLSEEDGDLVGIVRRAGLRLDAGGQMYDGFALALARRTDPTLEAPVGTLRLDFMGRSALPALTGAQVIAGDLIPELAGGRTIIIGPGDRKGLGGIATPLAERISTTRLHGYVVDTLLRGAGITEPSPMLRLMLLLLVGAGSMAALVRLGVRGLWFTLAALVIVPLLALLALPLLRMALPVTEHLVLQLLLSAVATRLRIVSEERALRDVVSESSHRLLQRIPNRSFLESPEHWQQLATLVDQTLDLRRSLFLERDPAAHRVREIVARRCSVDDIVEQRRDYDREPYRTAIAVRAALRLDEPYLEPEPQEVQYLVPLSHGGQVLGFWALTIAEDSHPDRAQLEGALKAFAEQIGEMLHLRALWQHEDLAPGASAEMRANESALMALHRTITAIERRLEIFEDVFASQQTATIVYDLFGQLVQTNPAMEALLGDMAFQTGSSTALDLLVATTGRDTAYCQGLLQVVMLQRRPVSLAVDLAVPGGERNCQLTVGPVAARPPEDEADEFEVRPFELAGLMIELQDVSRVHRVTASKEGLIERLGFRLRGDAEAIVLATSLLEDDTLDGEMRREIIDMLVERTRSATRVMDEARGYLTTSHTSQGQSCYPLDSVGLLKQAIDDAEDRSREKRLTLEVDHPAYPHLVLAEEDALSGLLHAILSLLVADAAEGSTVRLVVQESERAQTLHLFNQGFGIPDERFQHYIADAGASVGEEYERLREARELLERWGGRFSANSAIGTGFEFRLSLPIAI